MKDLDEAVKCPVILTAGLVALELPPVSVNAVVPLAPAVPATVTAVNPARVVEDAPKSISVLPTVTLSLDSLLFTILPASIPLVTVPVCPVCIKS